MRYFMVTVERGHCGNKHSSIIKFAFESKNLIEAMDRAKKMPSVKHTRGIVFGKEITKIEYEEYISISAYDRYEQHKAIRRR